MLLGYIKWLRFALPFGTLQLHIGFNVRRTIWDTEHMNICVGPLENQIKISLGHLTH
jgi:hypothetical protein